MCLIAPLQNDEIMNTHIRGPLVLLIYLNDFTSINIPPFSKIVLIQMISAV